MTTDLSIIVLTACMYSAGGALVTQTEEIHYIPGGLSDYICMGWSWRYAACGPACLHPAFCTSDGDLCVSCVMLCCGVWGALRGLHYHSLCISNKQALTLSSGKGLFSPFPSLGSLSLWTRRGGGMVGQEAARPAGCR